MFRGGVLQSIQSAGARKDLSGEPQVHPSYRESGACDRQLQEHPNLYADMSGHVVVQVLNRDRKYAREFLIRNQDKILWATDEGWWSFGGKDKQMNQHYTFFEELDLPDELLLVRG